MIRMMSILPGEQPKYGLRPHHRRPGFRDYAGNGFAGKTLKSSSDYFKGEHDGRVANVSGHSKAGKQKTYSERTDMFDKADDGPAI